MVGVISILLMYYKAVLDLKKWQLALSTNSVMVNTVMGLLRVNEMVSQLWEHIIFYNVPNIQDINGVVLCVNTFRICSLI